MTQWSYCSGGGGGLPIEKPELTAKISAMRLERAAELDVDTLVSACPWSERPLSEAGDRRGHRRGRPPRAVRPVPRHLRGRLPGRRRRPPPGPGADRRARPGPPGPRQQPRRLRWGRLRRRLRERFRRLRMRRALSMTITESAGTDPIGTAPFTREPLDDAALATLVAALRPVLSDDQILTGQDRPLQPGPRARAVPGAPLVRAGPRRRRPAHLDRAGRGDREDRERPAHPGRPARRRHRADRRRGPDAPGHRGRRQADEPDPRAGPGQPHRHGGHRASACSS